MQRQFYTPLSGRFLSRLENIIERQAMKPGMTSHENEANGEDAAGAKPDDEKAKGDIQGISGNSSVPMPGYAARPEVLREDEAQPPAILSDDRIEAQLEADPIDMSEPAVEAAPDTSLAEHAAQGGAMRHVGQVQGDTSQTLQSVPIPKQHPRR